MTMRLPYAVPKVLKALQRRKRVAVIDWRWNLLVGLWRLIPNALWVKIPMPVSTKTASPRQEEINAAEAVANPAGAVG